MWFNILNIVVASIAVAFAIVALVKVRREKRVAVKLLEEAVRISDETVAKSAEVERKIEDIIREMGGVPNEKA